MLTKWAKDVLTMSLSGNVLFDVEANDAGKHAVTLAKSLLNNAYGITWYSYGHGYSLRVSTISDTSSDGVYIGTGDTEPTENDYCLKSPITSGVTGSATKTNIYDSSTNTTKVRITITVTNNGSESITIKEVAKVVSFDTASAIGGVVTGNRRAIMVDRTLLETPVTIPAGEAGVIFYDFVYFDGSANLTTKAKKGN